MRGRYFFVAVSVMISSILLWIYFATTPQGGVCCDPSPGTSLEDQEKMYNEYLWWERKRNLRELFGQ